MNNQNELELCQARLAEAIGFIGELVDECAYGDNCPDFGTNHGKCLNCKAKDFVASTQPPPILAELERLREWFQNSYNVERCEFSPEEWRTLRDKALAERDAIHAQLQVAKDRLTKFTETTDGGAPVWGLEVSFASYATLAQLNTGEKQFQDRPLAVPVALDARGNDTREIPVQLNTGAGSAEQPKVGGEFYNGIEWFGGWLVDHAEGETVDENLVQQWATDAWRKHLAKLGAGAHSPDCDVNDKNPDGIVKPCNCQRVNRPISFESFITRKVDNDGTLHIKCKRGLWGVSGREHELVEQEAQRYFFQYIDEYNAPQFQAALDREKV